MTDCCCYPAAVAAELVLKSISACVWFGPLSLSNSSISPDIGCILRSGKNLMPFIWVTLDVGQFVRVRTRRISLLTRRVNANRLGIVWNGTVRYGMVGNPMWNAV